jgi:hypothetical protein
MYITLANWQILEIFVEAKVGPPLPKELGKGIRGLNED